MKQIFTMVVGILMFSMLSAQTYNVNDKIEGLDQGKWYKATILKTDGTKYFVHWDGYSSSYDSWLTTDKMRTPGTQTNSTSNNSNNTSNSGGNIDPAKYLTGDALSKFKKDMLPYNDWVSGFAQYLNPRPWISSIPFPNKNDLGDYMKKINELENLLKTNYPNNCNTVPDMDKNRYGYEFTEQPSVYREVCEKKIEIAQRVLEQESMDPNWNRRWSEQFEQMKTSVEEQAYMYNDYLQYLVFPKLYEKQKADRKENFEPIYKNVGIPYDDKRIFAYQDSMLVLMKKYVEDNISKCTYKSWTDYYPHQYSTLDKTVTNQLLSYDSQAKVLYIGYETSEPYKVYDENYYPAKLISQNRDGMVAYTLPYTSYVYIGIFTFVQDYSDGKYSAPHFQYGGTAYINFNGICVK